MLVLHLREKLVDLWSNALNDAVDPLGVGMDAVLLLKALEKRAAIEEVGIKHHVIARCQTGIDRAEPIGVILTQILAHAHIVWRFHAGNEHGQALSLDAVDYLGERGLDLG